MKDEILSKIQELMIERAALEQAHAGLIRGNQKMNQEFQERVVKNQTRYAQLTGAITELQKLVNPKGENNHDDSIPTLNIGDRPAHVRIGEQSESR